jgi:hypothetical protein
MQPGDDFSGIADRTGHRGGRPVLPVRDAKLGVLPGYVGFAFVRTALATHLGVFCLPVPPGTLRVPQHSLKAGQEPAHLGITVALVLQQQHGSTVWTGVSCRCVCCCVHQQEVACSSTARQEGGQAGRQVSNRVGKRLLGVVGTCCAVLCCAVLGHTCDS